MNASDSDHTAAMGFFFSIVLAIVLVFVMSLAINRMTVPTSSQIPVVTNPATFTASMQVGRQRLPKPQPPPPELLRPKL
jgi:hypothetical protein